MMLSPLFYTLANVATSAFFLVIDRACEHFRAVWKLKLGGVAARKGPADLQKIGVKDDERRHNQILTMRTHQNFALSSVERLLVAFGSVMAS